MMKKGKKININEKEIVMAQVRTYDSDFELSIGSFGTFSKKELLENIEKESEVGKQIVEIQMNYLRDLVSGDIYKILED